MIRSSLLIWSKPLPQAPFECARKAPEPWSEPANTKDAKVEESEKQEQRPVEKSPADEEPPSSNKQKNAA